MKKINLYYLAKHPATHIGLSFVLGLLIGYFFFNDSTDYSKVFKVNDMLLKQNKELIDSLRVQRRDTEDIILNLNSEIDELNNRMNKRQPTLKRELSKVKKATRTEDQEWYDSVGRDLIKKKN
jgi:uncharacterized protein HemX